MPPEDRPRTRRRGQTPKQFIEVGGEKLPVWIEQGQVRTVLPFDIDFVRLAQLLKSAGYFYANHPERVDTQGWGPRFDQEGYYPYWVFREGLPRPAGGRSRTVFAFPPQEYVQPGLPAARPERPRKMPKARTPAPDAEFAAELAPPARPVVGPRAEEELRRWVPFLRQAARPAQGDASSPPNG